ncbi:MAG: hypothetical protein AAGJ28_19785 [Pseudomonadota bacterium]
MQDLINRTGATEFDQIVLGTFDTKAGADWIAAETGVEPFLTTPEPGQWYWSAGVSLPDGAMIEILGPNPHHRGFHPLKTLLSRYDTPSPIFWHIGVSDFEGFCAFAAERGAPVDQIEHLDTDSPGGRRAYSRGILGPGFRSVRPCIIQWKARPSSPARSAPARMSVSAFELSHPDHAAMNTVFAELGLRQRISAGPHRMSIVLDTPRGEVRLDGRGLSFEGPGALLATAQLWIGHQFNRMTEWARPAAPVW